MTRSATAHARRIPFPLTAVLAILLSNAGIASAQVYSIETLFGDFDPLEAVPLDEAWVLHPTALATDSEGSLYFVDRETFRVRKVDRSGRVSTIAGSGLLGYSGDGGPATSARLGNRVEGLAVDGEGNVYIADTENYRIRRVDASGTITTFAGTGRWGTEGDGGPATRAGLTAIHGLAADAQGNLYVADTWDDRIRKIDTEGIITTVAGTGEEGVSGDGGPATEARLNKPRGVVVDAVGNLYIADSDNHRIRKVDSKGMITTVAGRGDRGYGGDRGSATEAALDEPYAVTVDVVGNIYVADSKNGIVRKVALDGTISTAAGTPPGTGAGPTGVEGIQSIGFPRALATGLGGELYIADSYRDSILRLNATGTVAKFVGRGQPELYRPGGVAVDPAGNVYVADRSNHRILRVDPDGVATTIAGVGERGGAGDGGLARAAALASPSDVALGDDGSTYIADTNNHRIRKVDSGGTITTVAGTGNRGFGGDSGPATDANLNSPAAVAVASDGTIFIADRGNRRIRKVDAAGVITTVAGTGEYGDARPGIPANESPLGWIVDVAVDSRGRVYIPEAAAFRVLRVELTGLLSVVAGTGEFGAHGDGGPATSARLWHPSGVAISDSGTLYIADRTNGRIRRVADDGIITTIAGSGLEGYDGDGGPATMFALHYPEGVAAASDETVIVVDSGNHRIRVLTAEAPRPAISSIVNGASYAAALAPGSVAVILGTDLAPGVAAAAALPQGLGLPTALLETSVTVRDLTETSWARRAAGLFSVSPTEIRIQIPEATATGKVIVTVSREGSVSERRGIRVTSVAPGLFSANGDGRGVAAATAVRRERDGGMTELAVSRLDTFRQRYVAVPLNVSGNRDQAYLTLFGTGFRGGSGPPTVTIGGREVAVESFGPATGFHGVDELVVGPIPGSLRGEGLDIVATVDGQASNAVTIAIE
ncbi:MAG: hypothetical protein OXH99_16725 [Bryobacterales bacterium]|nr:hypothetical protein [Bryobacterales bacterium]